MNIKHTKKRKAEKKNKIKTLVKGTVLPEDELACH